MVNPIKSKPQDKAKKRYSWLYLPRGSSRYQRAMQGRKWRKTGKRLEQMEWDVAEDSALSVLSGYVEDYW